MNEFAVQIEPKAGSITTNFADIKKQLQEEMSLYESTEVTESNLSDSKKDLAFLRKVRKAVDDKRKEVKKAYLVPYNEFEDSCKDLLSVIDKPIDNINLQIKNFDEKRIQEKKEHLESLFNENIEDLAEYINFNDTLVDSWANASYKDKDYLYALSEKKLKIKNDLNVITSLKSEIEGELLSIYKISGLANAIQRNTQYLNDKEMLSVRVVSDRTVAIDPVYSMAEFTDSVIVNAIFEVAKEDADKVRQFLDFSGIEYKER